MRKNIKKIVKEYSEKLSEQGGYDTEDLMQHHYSGFMTEMMESGESIFDEYVKLHKVVLPEILDENLKDGLINSLEKLEDFLEYYKDFLQKAHMKNVKRFNKKG